MYLMYLHCSACTRRTIPYSASTPCTIPVFNFCLFQMHSPTVSLYRMYLIYHSFFCLYHTHRPLFCLYRRHHPSVLPVPNAFSHYSACTTVQYIHALSHCSCCMYHMHHPRVKSVPHAPSLCYVTYVCTTCTILMFCLHHMHRPMFCLYRVTFRVQIHNEVISVKTSSCQKIYGSLHEWLISRKRSVNRF